MAKEWSRDGVRLICGDCLDVLPTLPADSVDAVITDPPYPCIKRDYGYWTVEEWWALIVDGVIPQVRRVLKPSGSAVFILQSNSEHIGQMRGWLWEFMAWVCRDWNMIQDVWWWNITTMPTVHCTQYGLLRESLKSCVWCGNPSCYREQSNVLWSESQSNISQRMSGRADISKSPSGHSVNRTRMTKSAKKRGGVTPFNVLPIANTGSRSGHSAQTPLKLADWWTKYIVPPNGILCDPFMGHGTIGIACVQTDRRFVGIEIDEGHFDIAVRRISEAMDEQE